MRILFHVQHLLGVGHLRRAVTLARALAADGWEVLLVSGGAPVEGLELGGARFHQLPPLRAADETLRDLARLDGRPADEAFCAARRCELLDLLHAEKPDVLITEQFPFGRTRLRFELLPLLEAAKTLAPPPLIVSSVRDVLRRASRERVTEAVAILIASFDAVLIHADPALVDFARSFADWDAIRSRAYFTGFVAETDLSRQPAGRDGADEVIVSVGGGAVGAPLLEAAIAARAHTPLAGRIWRLLVGANLPAAHRSALPASEGIVIEPARKDFTTLLANATLSISQAGYNTVVETLTCADRAVLVPFATVRETEQAERAHLLAERGMVALVPSGKLTAETLADAVRRAMAGPSLRSFPPCDTNGARRTGALLRQLTEARRHD
ncbi:MAG: glycosyl transferase family 28 [Alphaproteobacteria bacterium]|nr:glycosyl transferase family 28 [Alphaproteobacteria bacterium]MBV8411714.1 glycosyl transferase family 28 [Alphaproteobacteria bacterium]